MRLADAVRDWLERNSPAVREVKREATATAAAVKRSAQVRAEVEMQLGVSFKAADQHFRGRS